MGNACARGDDRSEAGGDDAALSEEFLSRKHEWSHKEVMLWARQQGFSKPVIRELKRRTSDAAALKGLRPGDLSANVPPAAEEVLLMRRDMLYRDQPPQPGADGATQDTVDVWQEAASIRADDLPPQMRRERGQQDAVIDSEVGHALTLRGGTQQELLQRREKLRALMFLSDPFDPPDPQLGGPGSIAREMERLLASLNSDLPEERITSPLVPGPAGPPLPMSPASSHSTLGGLQGYLTPPVAQASQPQPEAGRVVGVAEGGGGGGGEAAREAAKPKLRPAEVSVRSSEAKVLREVATNTSYCKTPVTPGKRRPVLSDSSNGTGRKALHNTLVLAGEEDEVNDMGQRVTALLDAAESRPSTPSRTPAMVRRELGDTPTTHDFSFVSPDSSKAKSRTPGSRVQPSPPTPNLMPEARESRAPSVRRHPHPLVLEAVRVRGAVVFKGVDFRSYRTLDRARRQMFEAAVKEDVCTNLMAQGVVPGDVVDVDLHPEANRIVFDIDVDDTTEAAVADELRNVLRSGNFSVDAIKRACALHLGMDETKLLLDSAATRDARKARMQRSSVRSVQRGSPAGVVSPPPPAAGRTARTASPVRNIPASPPPPKPGSRTHTPPHAAPLQRVSPKPKSPMPSTRRRQQLEGNVQLKPQGNAVRSIPKSPPAPPPAAAAPRPHDVLLSKLRSVPNVYAATAATHSIDELLQELHAAEAKHNLASSVSGNSRGGEAWSEQHTWADVPQPPRPLSPYDAAHAPPSPEPDADLSASLTTMRLGPQAPATPQTPQNAIVQEVHALHVHRSVSSPVPPARGPPGAGGCVSPPPVSSVQECDDSFIDVGDSQLNVVINSSHMYGRQQGYCAPASPQLVRVGVEDTHPAYYGAEESMCASFSPPPPPPPPGNPLLNTFPTAEPPQQVAKVLFTPDAPAHQSHLSGGGIGPKHLQMLRETDSVLADLSRSYHLGRESDLPVHDQQLSRLRNMVRTG